MKRLLPFLSFLFISGWSLAEPLKTVYSPFTGKLDYITKIDSNTVTGTGPCTSTSNANGTVSITCSGVGSASGIVSPGTFTWTNSFGIGASTVAINTATMSISTAVTHSFMGQAGFIAIKEHYAYVSSNSSNTVTVFDIASATNPVFVSQFISGGEFNGAEGMDISGKYLYLTSMFTDTLTVFDISNPASIVEISSISDVTNMNNAEQVKIVGNYALIVNYGANGAGPGLTSVDISNPKVLSVVSTVISSSITAPVYLQIQYPYAYLTNEDSLCNLNVIDISNPRRLSVAGFLHLTGCSANMLTSDIQGKYWYIGGFLNDAIYVVDISTPTAPTQVRKIPTGIYDPSTVKVMGNRLFASSVFGNSILQFSLVDPSSPTLINILTDNTNLSGPDDIVPNGGYLYVTTHGSHGIGAGFSVINIGNLSVPAVVAGSIISDELEVTHDIRSSRLFVDGGLQAQSIWAQNQITASTVTASSATLNTLNVASIQFNDGTIQVSSAPAGGASGSGIVSPGTFTWTNTKGISLSSAVITGAGVAGGSTIFSAANGGTTWLTVNSNGVGINAAPNSSFNLNVGASIQAIDHMVSPYYQQVSAGAPALSLQSNGAHFGLVENETANDLWSLAYGNTASGLGTPVLSWTSGNQVRGPSTSFVSTTSSFSVLGTLGLGVTYGVTAGTGTFYTTSPTTNALVVQSTNNLTGFHVSNSSVTAGDFMLLVSSVPTNGVTPSAQQLMTLDTFGNLNILPQNLATLKTTTPARLGMIVYCTDCTASLICVSTGTAAAYQYSSATAKGTGCL